MDRSSPALIALAVVAMACGTTHQAARPSPAVSSPHLTAPAAPMAKASPVPAAVEHASGPWDLPLPPDPPVAWMDIASLGLQHVPVYDRGLDGARNMVIAPGMSITHYVYSGALDGRSNAVLYGHEGGVFARLSQLHAGALIRLTLVNGTVTSFSARSPVSVSPSDLSIMSGSSSPELTLFTCHGWWDSQRTVVVAT